MIITTETRGLGKKLLDACTEKQQFLIDDFKGRIKALTESDGIGNEDSFDNQDVASNTTRVSEINTLNNLLEFAHNELEMLENLKTTEGLDRDHVAPTRHNCYQPSYILHLREPREILSGWSCVCRHINRQPDL
ncbi:MAG TPA: hypothetical protein VIQ51_01380 [Chryseosolibacter sp.]|jgi:hypothetical protein